MGASAALNVVVEEFVELALASTLLYVDLSGNPGILLREPGFFTEIWGIPSPDGKHLAFRRYNFGNNANVLEGF